MTQAQKHSQIKGDQFKLELMKALTLVTECLQYSNYFLKKKRKIYCILFPYIWFWSQISLCFPHTILKPKIRTKDTL